MTRLEQLIADTLGAHTVEDYSEGEYDGDASLLCACGIVARGSDLYGAGAGHRLHVARQLRVALGEEGWR